MLIVCNFCPWNEFKSKDDSSLCICREILHQSYLHVIEIGRFLSIKRNSTDVANAHGILVVVQLAETQLDDIHLAP